MSVRDEGIEKRVYARVQTNIVVKYLNDFGMFDEYLTGDISMGGIYIQTENPLPIGTRQEIILCLPDGSQEVTVLGEVVRHTPPPPGQKGMGIRFALIEPALRGELEKFIHTLLLMRGSDQRSSPRIKARLRVQVNIKGKLNRALLEDIGRGGLFVTLQGDIQLMDLLEVMLVHPVTHKEIPVLGQVIHKRDMKDPKTNHIAKGIGLQFVQMTEEKKREIDDFLKSLASS